MKKKTLFGYEGEEVVRINGKIIGSVWPDNDPYQSIDNSWEYYCNLSDQGINCIDTKEEAIECLKDDHKETLKEKKVQLKELIEEIKIYHKIPESWLK